MLKRAKIREVDCASCLAVRGLNSNPRVSIGFVSLFSAVASLGLLKEQLLTSEINTIMLRKFMDSYFSD